MVFSELPFSIFSSHILGLALIFCILCENPYSTIPVCSSYILWKSTIMQRQGRVRMDAILRTSAIYNALNFQRLSFQFSAHLYAYFLLCLINPSFSHFHIEIQACCIHSIDLFALKSKHRQRKHKYLEHTSYD